MRPPTVCLAVLLGLASAACSRAAAAPDGGEDSSVQVFDLCDTSPPQVGTACPLASPVRCFAMCEAGGCFCRATPEGPEWACVTDFSCVPDCGPLDDACGVMGLANDAEEGDSE